MSGSRDEILAKRNMAAEEAVLGILMNYPADLYEIDLEPASFYGSANQALFAEIQRQIRETGEVSPRMLAANCRLDAPEINDRVMDLLDGGVIGRSAIVGFAKHISDCAAIRATAREYMRFAKQATEDGTASDVRELGARLCELAGKGIGDGFVSLGKYATTPEADPAQEGEFFFPVPLFEDVIPSAQPGQIIVIGGRPGDGKSMYLNHVMAAATPDAGVAVFSYEMTKRELFDRLMAHVYELDHGSLSRGAIMPEEYARHRADAAERMANIWIEDCQTTSVDLSSIEARLTKLCARQKIRAACIDYIQLIPTRAKHSERVQELSRMTARLKQLAKRLGIVIFELAQLNRDSVKAEREPTIADLKESGSIEQDANIIIIIHRTPEDSRLLLRKNRGGRGQYDLSVKAQGSMMRFIGQGEAEPRKGGSCPL